MPSGTSALDNLLAEVASFIMADRIFQADFKHKPGLVHVYPVPGNTCLNPQHVKGLHPHGLKPQRFSSAKEKLPRLLG